MKRKAAFDKLPNLLKTDEYAKICRVYKGTVDRWIETDKIVAIKVGSTWRIPKHQPRVFKLYGLSKADVI